MWKRCRLLIPLTFVKNAARNVAIQRWTQSLALLLFPQVCTFQTSRWHVYNAVCFCFSKLGLNRTELPIWLNFVCPASKKVSLIDLCLLVRLLHNKYIIIWLFLFSPAQHLHKFSLTEVVVFEVIIQVRNSPFPGAMVLINQIVYLNFHVLTVQAKKSIISQCFKEIRSWLLWII